MGTGKTYSTKYLLDSNNNSGVAGQVLSTTSTGIDWVDANTVPGTGLWLANGNDIYNSNSGNVGIGTTSPLGKLHVYNTATTSNGNGTASETAIGQDSITLYGHGGTNGQTYGSITWMGGSRRRAMISAVAENADTDYIGLAFYTQGTDGSGNYNESMRISRSGNVGIGTTSPGAKLEVGANVAKGVLINRTFTTSSQTLANVRAYYGLAITPLRTGTGGLYFTNYDADTPIIQSVNTSDVAQFLLLNPFGGNVGIGTTSPDGNLEVITSTIVSGASDTVNNVLIGLQAANRPTIILDTADTTYTNRTWNITNVGSAGKLFIGRNGLDVMVMDNSGNVGIGTSSPQTYLQIGDYPSNNIDITTYPDVPSEHMIHLTAPETTNRYGGGISFGENAFTAANITVQDAGGGGSLNMLFGTRHTSGIVQERMRITSAGNVGIGTTSPNSKLQIKVGTDQNIGFNSHSSVARISSYNDAFTASSPLKINGSDLRFDISSVEKMRITSTGNVGIGTTTPSQKLEVAGRIRVTTDPTLEVYEAANKRGGFQWDSTNDWVNIFSTGGDIRFDLGGEKMRITTGGNVGIGRTNPAVPLDVEGKIRSNDSSSGDYLEIFCDGSVSGDSYIENTNNNIQIKSAFATSFSTSGSVAMFIKNNQNVGIGTTSPNRQLTVSKADTATGFGNHTGPVIAITQTNTTVNNQASLIFQSVNGAVAEITSKITNHSSYYGDLLFGTRSAGGYTAKMTILSTGNVGIGTTSPGAKLDVAGIIFAGDGNKATPGYSFASDPDTGMFRDSANVLTFGVGADRRMSISNTVITTALPLGVNTTGVTSGIKLQVQGNVLFGSSGVGDFYLGNYATANHFRFHTNNSNTYFDMNCGDIYWRQGTSTRYQFFPSTANMTVQGTITQNSDARIKENVVEISDCISKVQAMRGVYYNRTDFNTDVTKVGVIAQEVEAVLPELVLESPETGLKSVAYSELTSVLINAIKEQQEIIEDLKTRITKLEN